jgi:hypothetical protein
MTRHSIFQQASIWAICTAVLALAPKFIYDLDYALLLQAITFQGKVAIVSGLISGLTIAILQRSVKFGGIILFGVFYGVMFWGTSALTIGCFLMLIAPKGGTDALLPGLGFVVLAFVVWIIGQLVGGILGGLRWFRWYANRRRSAT